MSLFNELLHNPMHEGWNEDDIPTLRLVEIKFLCIALGAPKSGTKEKVTIRLLAIRQVRLKLAKYTLEDRDQLVADFPKEPLKWMAKEAGLWRSGNKKQLATVLLNWREEARAAGKKFIEEQQRLTAQVRASDPQLTFKLL